MRSILALPILAALALAACSSEKAADAPKSEAEVAAAVNTMEKPQAGQYRTTINITDLTIPGMSAAQAAQAKGAFSATGQSVEYCLTPEQADMGYEEMNKRAGQGDCKFDHFNAAGGTLDAKMTCQTGKGMVSTSELKGTVSATGSHLTMVTDSKMPGMPGGGMKMTAEVTMERIGDCAK